MTQPYPLTVTLPTPSTRKRLPLRLRSNGLLGSADSVSKALTKVNSSWPDRPLEIALHSPRALLETGLRMRPPEKSQDGGPLCSRGVCSLQSALLMKYCEIRAYFEYFKGKDGGISLQSRLCGGESATRNLVTFSNSPSPDVCVTCRQ